MLSRKMNLIASKNNKNLQIDNSNYEMVIDFAEKIADNKSFDPEVLSYAEFKEDNFDHICLVNFADIHFFDQGMQKKRFDIASKFLSGTSNAVAVLSGDTFTVSTLSGASNAHVNKINNTNSAILGRKCLKSVKNKILFGVGGNHDGEHGARNRDSNISLTRLVLDSLDIDYFQYNALLKIELDNKPFYVLVTHGSGKASSKEGAIDVIKKKCEYLNSRFNIYPNLVLTGHFHADVNGRYMMEVPVYKNGILVSTKTQELIVESAPALQGDSEFTAAHNMDTSIPNVNAFDISFKRNPYYNAKNSLTESPIIWNVIKFPILRSKTDALSKSAKVYMETYKEPEIRDLIEDAVQRKNLNLDSLKNGIKEIAGEVKGL